MPEVKVTHSALTSDDARKAPKREPIPPGTYQAIIVSAPAGATRHTPPLAKVSVEFQILFAIAEDKSHDETHQGRRVYQDYILEPEAAKPDMNEIRRYELRMLLDAAEVEYTDAGFNTDHLVNKNAIITVKHRKGRQADDDGNYPIFTNVVKVDTATPVDADALV
jgi:hypothetical protein